MGVTHFSFLLGTYCSGVLRGKTSVLEWNGSGDFERILRTRIPGIHRTGKNGKDGRSFSQKNSPAPVTIPAKKPFNIMELDIWADAGTEELFFCKENCDYAVIDFGAFREEIRGEWLRCDRRFLVGSLSEWQTASLAELLAGGNMPAGTEYFITFGEEEKREMAERIFGCPLRRIPLTGNAFTVNADVLAAFRTFLS